jgi:activator of HSP90 ATPase
MYRFEKQGEKPGVLTRRKQNLSAETDDLRKEHQRQIMLKDNQLNRNVKKALTLCVLIRSAAQRDKEISSFPKRTLLDKETSSQAVVENVDDSIHDDTSQTETKNKPFIQTQTRKAKKSIPNKKI